MIKTQLGIYSVEDTVTNPVITAVAQDILKFLGLSSTTYLVLDQKDTLLKTKNKLGTITGQIAAYDEVAKIEFTDESEDGNELSLAIVNPDYTPIYIDKEIRSYCVPIYHKRKISISFKYFTKSQSKANMIVNKLRLTTSNDSMYSMHNLEYSFILNPMFLRLLINIVDLKNKRNTPTEQITLESYINQTFDNRIDFMNTMDGKTFKRDVAIREAQNAVVGFITDDLHNLACEVDEANNMFGVVFNYEFHYEKPVSLLLQYPFLVYNNTIAKEFRDFIKDKEVTTAGIRTRGSIGIMELTERKNKYLNIDKNKYYLAIPKEDVEVLPKPQPNTARVLGIMIKLDENNKKNLLNIKTDIPNVAFKDNVMNYLLTHEIDMISNIGESLFYLELFRNGKKVTNIKLILDKDGNLSTDVDLDLKSIYKVSIGVITDTAVLSKNAKKRLKEYLLNEYGTIGNTNGSFVENYVSLLSIPTEQVINNVKTTKYEDLIFTIKEPFWASFFTKETVINVTGFLHER